jgi:flagellar biosynthesis/type III secretory pathway protein FliH
VRVSSGFQPFNRSRPPSTKLVAEGTQVEVFELKNFRLNVAPSYQAIKSKFKAEIINDKKNRFILSEHVANQLSVEQEELIRFEKRVAQVLEERLSVLSEQTKEAAYKEGFETGKNQAYEEEKANIAKQIEMLAAAVHSMAEAKNLLAEQYEKYILEIIFRVSKVIVNYEIQNHPEAISFTLIDILNKISKDDEVMVYLAPDEFEAIDKIQEQLSTITRLGRISFQLDQRLEKGSCVVEALSGEIRSSIDEKFKRVEEEVYTNHETKKAKGA